MLIMPRMAVTLAFFTKEPDSNAAVSEAVQFSPNSSSYMNSSRPQ